MYLVLPSICRLFSVASGSKRNIIFSLVIETFYSYCIVVCLSVLSYVLSRDLYLRVQTIDNLHMLAPQPPETELRLLPQAP
jgi:hypothetical protein